MRLLAVADLHARAARLDRLAAAVERLAPDAVVVAGDITAYLEPDPIGAEHQNGRGLDGDPRLARGGVATPDPRRASSGSRDWTARPGPS